MDFSQALVCLLQFVTPSQDQSADHVCQPKTEQVQEAQVEVFDLQSADQETDSSSASSVVTLQ